MAAETELGGYQLVGRLAVGGMAEIYQAKSAAAAQRSPDEPDEVVLKRLLPAFRADSAFVKAFVDEARLTVRLRHPHIVRTFKCFKAGHDYLMVQELVAGRTLGYMQDAFFKAERAMPLSASVYIVGCLLKALDYVHRVKVSEQGGGTIVHRDVNPSNLLLGISGDVKLTDFGIAEVTGNGRGDTGALRGTVAYMAPEAVLGQGVDHRSDLFAAGAILWELLANKRLYEGDHDLALVSQARDARITAVETVNPEVPVHLGRVVRRALFADRAARFQTAGEMLRALEVCAAREGWPFGVDALKPLLGG